MTSESGEMVVDGGRRGTENPRDLAVGSTRSGVFVDLRQEFGPFQPV